MIISSAKPEFFSTSSDFRVVLKNINYHEISNIGHDTGHDNQIVKLLDYCSVPRSREEMQTLIGVSSRTYFSNQFLIPMLAAKQLAMTIPNKPKSKKQRYISVFPQKSLKKMMMKITMSISLDNDKKMMMKITVDICHR